MTEAKIDEELLMNRMEADRNGHPAKYLVLSLTDNYALLGNNYAGTLNQLGNLRWCVGVVPFRLNKEVA